VLSSAPLSDWQEADSSPSAEDCAQAIGNSFKGNYIIQLSLRQGGQMPMNELAALMQQTQHATCIASDDPRLLQNTKQAGK
jgi:hypothetical protein